jgi:hypothetical protein
MTPLETEYSPSSCVASIDDELAAYAAANIDERRAVLDALDVPLPTVDQFDADTPVEIDRIEWFATGTEIAAAHLWLDKYRDRPGFEPLAAIVGDNPGVPLDPDVWSAVSFKGGSEPGVIFLGWLLQREDGRRFVVAVSVTNATGPVDEIRVASAGAGIIGLLGDLP